MTFRMAIRGLTRHRLRSAVTIAGLAIAIALLCDMLMLATGMDKSILEILSTLGYEIRICPAGTLPFTTEAEVLDSSAVADSVRGMPGVAKTLRVLGASVFLHRDSGEVRPLFAIGIEGEAPVMFRMIEGRAIDGRTAGASGAVGVLVNTRIRDALGLSVGDSLRIDRYGAGSAGGDSGSLLCRVEGIVAFHFDLDRQWSVAVPLESLQSFLGKSEDPASFVMAKLDSPADETFAPREEQTAVAERIRAAFPEFSVYSIEEFLSEWRNALAYFRQFSVVLGSISVLIAFLLVGIVLLISVNERRGEIAAMRSIGFRRRTLHRMVLAEALALIVASSVAGVLLGLVLSRALDDVLTASPGIPDSFAFFVPGTAPLGAAVAIAVATALVAAIFPALHATRIDIVRTLHEEIL